MEHDHSQASSDDHDHDHPAQQHPNSDDSISAYIHNTSSPQEQQSQSSQQNAVSVRDQDQRLRPDIAQRIQSPSSSGSSDERENERGTSPSPHKHVAKKKWLMSIPARDAEAASGILNLGASASASESSSSSSTQSSQESIRRRAAVANHNHVPEFFIHRDDDQQRRQTASTTGSTADASHLRAGARLDAVLYNNGPTSSQPTPMFYQQRDATPVATDAQPPPAQGEEEGTGHSANDDETAIGTAPAAALAVAPEAADASGKKRRRRTKKEEADVLSSIYVENAFPDSATRQHLANQLGMTTRAVSIWFQNRRQAERKRASRVTSTSAADESSGAPVSVNGKFPRSASSASFAPLRSASNSFSKSQLQRWPSLDAFAASQNSSFGRQSPSSDDEELAGEDTRDESMLSVGASTVSQCDTSLNTTISEVASTTAEDKENVPPASTAAAEDSIIVHEDGAASRPHTPRHPLKDIRDLVFGFDTLPQRKEDGGDAVESDVRARLQAAMSQSQPRRNGDRAPFGRSASMSVARKPSMDTVVGDAYGHKSLGSRQPPRRSTSDLLRFASLSTSQRGRASLDGKPSPPKKQPYIIKSLLESSHLPPAMAKLIQRRASEQAERVCERKEEADDGGAARHSTVPQAGDCADDGDSEHYHHHDANRRLLEMMQSSSSGISGSDMDNFHRGNDDECTEDEEVTLRMAANRRAARAQALGKEAFPPSDAMSDLMSRPWARSVSGPAAHSHVGKMLPPATLDATAGRDRSRPNLHASVARHNLPLTQLRVADMRGSMAGEPQSQSQSQSQSLPQSQSQPASSAPTTKSKKRKSIGLDKAAGRSSKKGRRSKGGEGTPAEGAAVSSTTVPGITTPSRSAETQAMTDMSPSRGLDIASPLRDVYDSTTSGPATGFTPPSGAGLPSFGTPRTGIGASGKRAFGRSISAQTPGPSYAEQGYLMPMSSHPQQHQAYGHFGGLRMEEDPHSPMMRPLSSAFLTSTPAASQLMMGAGGAAQHAPSTLSRRSSSMLAPSLLASADGGSGGREMTPRSLAFSLGLTHGTGAGSGGHGGAPTQTPFASAGQHGGPGHHHAHTLHGHTPFSAGGTSFSTRYLSSSSRDIRGLPGYTRAAAPYSPLAKGRGARENGGMMIGSNASGGGAGLGLGNPPASATRRVPFSRISSQPTASSATTTTMTTPAKRSREPFSSGENKENNVGRIGDPADDMDRFVTPRRRSPRKATMAVGAGVGDDSGFVREDEEVVGGRKGALPSLHESPTRTMQMEQRQNDAAEVLLGLAGEGR